ncbi:MAG TPA: GAF domain-containing protein [Trichocoleus sp.]|jgi:signal transduction histidine kinase/CheY-like chemotaxis protein
MATILVVEANRASARKIRDFLQGTDYELFAIVPSASAALEIALTNPLDLILMKITRKGEKARQRISEQIAQLQIPVIYFVASDAEHAAQAIGAEGFGLLVQPFHRLELLTAIKSALEYRALQQQLQSGSGIAQRQQAEWERILSSITRRIRQSLNLNDVLSTAVNEIRQLVQTDRVVIYQFAPDWSGIVIAESVGNDWISVLGRRILDPCLTPEQCIIPYQEGYIGNTEDIDTAGFAPCYVDLLRELQVRANLVIPILQNDALWGLLAAQHCAAPRHWETWEVDWLIHLVDQVTIAIQQSELYEQVQRLNLDLEAQVAERTAQLQQAYDFEATLKRITDRVRDSLDEANILRTVVEELTRAIGVNTCNAALYDLAQRTSTICYEYSSTAASFRSYTIPMSDFPPGYQQLLQGEYFQFCPFAPSSQPDNSSKLACPIQDDQGILGDLWLIHRADFAYTAVDIRLVQQVANQCAIAIRQSRLYQAAQNQVIKLGQLNRLKDDFLSTVSHELRTPIANIRMATQMLEIALNQAEAFNYPMVERYFQILQNECQREAKLINDLLDISQLDTETEPLELTPIDIAAHLQQRMSPLIERTQNRQQIELAVERNLPLLTTNLLYLDRVLTELIDNACKYSPAGATITLFARSTQLSFAVGVQNSGVEIDPAEIPRIFERFYRIPNADPWQYGGTGLGLALVQKLVNRLGATIQVESGNQSTSFTVHFPYSAENMPISTS